MGEAAPPVHVLLIPFLGRSRALSIVGTALLLARRGGFRCTIVSTPGNASYIRGAIEHSDNPVELVLVPFPAAEAGLPAGVECTDSLPTGDETCDFRRLYKGMQLLRRPVEELIVDLRPDVVLFDYVLYWYADVADSHSVPFFLLDTMSPFSRALFSVVWDDSGAIDESVCPSPGSDTVGPLTALPHPLEFVRSEVPAGVGTAYPGMLEKVAENDRRSCGIVCNSFEELTPEYLEYCRRMTDGDLYGGGPSKLRCIGPVQFANQDAGGKWEVSAIKKWLDSKQPESVLYVSFGSECFFSAEQLREIAVGLQGCGHPFLWVVRGNGGGAETMDEWLPQGFREAVGDRGLIVTEWAPQFEILNHRATGAFVTHCGWRSTLESVCAGLPVIPWPLHSEQFVNERLLVEILRVGVRILEGPEMRTLDDGAKGLVRGEVIGDAVDRLLGGRDEAARAMRSSAKKYKELARAAVAEGGSSYVNLSNVIEQMKMLAKEKRGLVAA